MGFVVGGFGGGAMVFNQIQTAIVNYENYKVSEASWVSYSSYMQCCQLGKFFEKKKILGQFLGYQFGAVNTDIFWKEMHL